MNELMRRAFATAIVAFVTVAVVYMGHFGWEYFHYKPQLHMSLLNSHDATYLLLCQTDKVYRDLGVHEGKKYLIADVAPRSIEQSETIQEGLWKDGYVCDAPSNDVPWQAALQVPYSKGRRVA